GRSDRNGNRPSEIRDRSRTGGGRVDRKKQFDNHVYRRAGHPAENTRSRRGPPSRPGGAETSPGTQGTIRGGYPTGVRRPEPAGNPALQPDHSAPTPFSPAWDSRFFANHSGAKPAGLVPRGEPDQPGGAGPGAANDPVCPFRGKLQRGFPGYGSCILFIHPSGGIQEPLCGAPSAFIPLLRNCSAKPAGHLVFPADRDGGNRATFAFIQYPGQQSFGLAVRGGTLAMALA